MNGPDYLSPLRPDEVPVKLDELWRGAIERIIFFPQADGSMVTLERLGSRQKMCVTHGGEPAVFHVRDDGAFEWDRSRTTLNPYMILKNLDVKDRSENAHPLLQSYGGLLLDQVAREALYTEASRRTMQSRYPELMASLAEQVRWGHIEQEHAEEYDRYPLAVEELIETISNAPEHVSYEDADAWMRVHEQVADRVVERLQKLDERDISRLYRDFPGVDPAMLAFAAAHADSEKILAAMLSPIDYERLADNMKGLGWTPRVPNTPR